MQRCADCGHPNRPEVRFCTHCGKPQAASGTTARGPTPIVAVVVLAVGLLAFLSIRPIVPREASTAAIDTSVHVVETSTGVADPAVERAVVPVPATRAELGETAPTADTALPADVAMPVVPLSVAQSLPAAPASSSPAKRASIDPAPARRSAPSQHAAGWLQKLRTDLAACEGDFVVRTICRETAKHRHCASANAWGKVAECPAARLPDLANFN